GTTGNPRHGCPLRRPQRRAVVPAPVARGAGPAGMPALRGAVAAPGRACRQVRRVAAGSWLSNVLDQTLAEPVKSTVNRGHGSEAIERWSLECLLNGSCGHAIELGRGTDNGHRRTRTPGSSQL